MFFGFSSLEQLHKWFTKENLEEMAAEGFVIKKYELYIVYQGKYQVLFDRKPDMLCNTENGKRLDILFYYKMILKYFKLKML